jgi:hypothetical protein
MMSSMPSFFNGFFTMLRVVKGGGRGRRRVCFGRADGMNGVFRPFFFRAFIVVLWALANEAIQGLKIPEAVIVPVVSASASLDGVSRGFCHFRV